MKLKVYQQGGGLIYTPFIPGRTESKITGSSSNEGDDSKIDPLDKEILALMKDQDLLPSDIEAISSALVNFQKRTQHLGNPALGGSGNYRSVMPGMLQIMKMVSIAKHNKGFWNDKVTEMQKHDAGSEVAMDSYGRMWVQDKESGGLTRVNPNEFDKEKYNPVSNSQLLYLRQRNYGFGDELIGEGGMDIVGAGDLRKEVDEIIKNFGKISSENYVAQDMSNIAKEIQEKGIFKVSKTRSKAELNDFSGLLYAQLGESSKHLLNARAALNGYTPIEYLQNVIFSNTSRDDKISYEAGLTKAAGVGGAGAEDPKNLTDRNYVEQVITGSNFEWPTQNRFAVIGNHADIWAYTQNVGLIQAGMNGGESVGYMPLDKLRNIEVFAQGSNQQRVTLGDKPISTAQQSAVIYDDSAMYRVNLPSREDNGDIVPDWNTIDLIEQLKDRINPELGKEQIDRILHQYDKDLYWDDATKTIVSNRSSWFLTFTGIVGSDFVQGIDFNSDHFEEITGSDAQMWHKRYDEAVKQNGKSSASQGRFGWLTPTKLYKANVYMPITNPLAGSKEYYSKATHMNNMQTQAIQEHRAEEQRKKENGTLKTNWSYGE